MSGILVNLLGLSLIGFIIWWFWFSRPEIRKTKPNDIIEIHVKDGIYQPAYIEIPIYQAVTLRFIREDATACAAVVIFNELNIIRELPLGKATDIPINLSKEGQYEFTCEMRMYRGVVIGV